jgi:hypothetical protein
LDVTGSRQESAESSAPNENLDELFKMLSKYLLSLALLASCSAPSVSVIPAMIDNSLDGSISASSTGVASEGNDLDGLGLGDSDLVFAPRVDLNFLSSQISITNSSSSFSGSGTLDADIDFGGSLIEALKSVDTEMDISATSLLWTFNFINTDTAHFGVGLGLSVFDFDLKMEETGAPMNSTATDEILPVPLIGIRAGGDLGMIRIAGSLSALQVDADGGEISVTDLDVYAGIDVIGDTGSLIVGYRSFDLDASYEDGGDSVALELGLGGPYFGLRLSF